MPSALWNSWWDHLRDLTTPTTRQWKDDFWAKAGLLRFLAEDPELAAHILPGMYVKPWDLQSGNFPNIPEEYKNKSRFLYRSTNPHDAYEFIGQLPTLSGTGENHIQTLETVQSILSGNTLTAYLEEKWIPHQSKETGVYLQEQLPLSFRGSIVEHPHRRWVYLISHTWANHGEDIHSPKYHLELETYDDNGKPLREGNALWQLPNPPLLVELYKKIREKGIFEDGISFQIEFWITRDHRPYIFQLRQFRPFEDARNTHRSPSGWSTIFWVTPEEGIDICAQSIHCRYMEQFMQQWIQKKVNGLIVPFLHENLHPSVFKGMEFFAVWWNSRPSLEHHAYDAAMKVRYVLLSPYMLPEEIRENYLPDTDTIYNIRHTSDGIQTMIKMSSDLNSMHKDEGKQVPPRKYFSKNPPRN